MEHEIKNKALRMGIFWICVISSLLGIFDFVMQYIVSNIHLIHFDYHILFWIIGLIGILGLIILPIVWRKLDINARRESDFKEAFSRAWNKWFDITPAGLQGIKESTKMEMTNYLFNLGYNKQEIFKMFEKYFDNHISRFAKFAQ